MSSFAHFQSQPAPQDLDYLINDLRFPAPSTTVRQVLGYMLHYLPYLKHEHNLRLVFAAFLNSPVCFGNAAVANLNSLYLIIEVFKLAADQKLKISQPSLPVKTWYTVLRKELTHFYEYDPRNGWKVLPVIAGLALASPLRDELYTRPNVLQYGWFCADWDRQMTRLFRRALGGLGAAAPAATTDMSLMSLAIFHNSSHNVLSFTEHVPPAFIVCRLVDMLASVGPLVQLAFGPALDASTYHSSPVVKHINKVSLLLESYLKRLPVDDNEANGAMVLYTVDRLLEMNCALSHWTQQSRYNQPPGGDDSEFWLAAKTLLFAQVVVFQGVLTAFLGPRRQGDAVAVYRQVALGILQSLYHLNFALLAIGQGGFDLYNFVYYLAIEIALDGGYTVEPFENMTRVMIGDYREVNLYAVHHDYIVRSKVLFVLGLWENYLGQQTQRRQLGFAQEVIRPICFEMAAKGGQGADLDVVEGLHSVLLLLFAHKKNLGNAEILEYLRLVLGQFPGLLSANQLSIAVETLGKFVLQQPRPARSSSDFLEFLYAECTRVAPGMLIKPSGDTMGTAQPIAKYEANLTMLHYEEDDSELGVDIIDANKKKKPKDQYFGPKIPKRVEHELQRLGSVAAPERQREATKPRLQPETVREATTFAFINLVPYLPLNAFVQWLDRIWILIRSSNRSEDEFLQGALWRVLSENLDPNRCDVAYDWWYERQQVPLGKL